jgi:hypothetical protein
VSLFSYASTPPAVTPDSLLSFHPKEKKEKNPSSSWFTKKSRYCHFEEREKKTLKT